MKFVLCFKTPDVLDYCLKNYRSVGCRVHHKTDLDCQECFDLMEKGQEEVALVKHCAEGFIQYGECITIEFDTNTQTATVIPVKR